MPALVTSRRATSRTTGRARHLAATLVVSGTALLLTWAAAPVISADPVVASGPARQAAEVPGTGSAGTAGTAAAARRPNIVLIVADDMRADEIRFMPRTRRVLGDAGVTFTNSFSPHPLCCPARASILTGRYTHNHRIFTNGPGSGGFGNFDDDSTLASWLERSGYATVWLGKYLTGFGPLPEEGTSRGDSLDYVPPGWTSWRASIDGGLPPGHPQAGGSYQYFNTTITRNGNGFESFRGTYQSNAYGRVSEDIVSSRAAGARPFFLAVNYTAPHSGRPTESDDPTRVARPGGGFRRFLTPARPTWAQGRFDDVAGIAPGLSWDGAMAGKPRYLRRLPRLLEDERTAIREVARQRAETLSVLDLQVERTVDALRTAGELEDSIVVFTSDNGYLLGEQRVRQGKKLPHEASLRVPLLMRGPGIPAGQVRHDPVMTVDLAPTFLDAAEATPAYPMDGRSVLGVARQGDRGWTRGVLTETGNILGGDRATNEAGEPLAAGMRRDRRSVIGVRTERWKYLDVVSGDGGAAEELYDLHADPREERNLVAEAAYAEPLTALRAELRRLRACDGEACRRPLAAELQTTSP